MGGGTTVRWVTQETKWLPEMLTADTVARVTPNTADSTCQKDGKDLEHLSTR